MTIKVYLAGPDVFLRDALEVGKRKCALCRDYGVEGLFPLDENSQGNEKGVDIFEANVSFIRRADAGLFNLSPFRGVSADAGTVFELGYMYAQGKPVYGYSNETARYEERIRALLGSSNETHSRDLDEHGHMIEQFGLSDNLMIDHAIRQAGSDICTITETTEPRLAAFTAFEASLKNLCDEIRV